MPCTKYVFERSLLIDGLSAGARGCVLAAVVGLTACRSVSPASTAPEPVPVLAQNQPPLLPAADRSCDPFISVGRARDTLDVVTVFPILPSDLRAAPTAGHRFVFERAYQTLLRVDCAGRAYPDLAFSWSLHNVELTMVTLRTNARFWNGDRVTTRDVVAAWQASGDSLARAFADSTQFSDDSVLFINIKSLDVRVLASPRLAVMRPLAGSPWPEGTGTHRLAQSGALTLQPVQRDSHPAFHVRAASQSDARNLIDDGIDILLTGDSATAAYAARRLSASPVPLEWDRTWMLIVPGSRAERSALAGDSVRVNAIRDDLARDAVRANARRAEYPAWVFEPPICFAQATTTTTRPRIAYQSDDPIARAIAERLVALGSPRTADTSVLVHLDPALASAGSRLTAAPLGGAAFDAALRTGSEVALVLPVTHRSARFCPGAQAIPLVDSRWQAVIRPGLKRAP